MLYQGPCYDVTNMNINDASNGIDDHISNDYELRVKLGHPKCTSSSLFTHQ